MKNFEYKARDQEGKTVTGEIKAPDERSASDLLWDKRLIVISLRAASATPQGPKRRYRKPTLEELTGFSRQLATMLKAGVPLVQALRSLGRQGGEKGIGQVVQEVALGVENGLSFSESLARFPKVFDRLYVSMVHASEQGGVMAQILSRLAAYLEASVRLRKKVRSAMMYPLVVCVIGVGISIFLMVKIIPVFAEIFGDFGSKLPTPTLILIHVSEAIRSNLLIVSIGSVVLGFAIRYLKRTPAGTLFWDKFKVRLPIVGIVAHKIALSRFIRTLSVLLKSGVPIVSALQTGAKSAGNRFFENCILEVAGSIEQGNTLVAAMSQHKVFPVMLVDMVAVGEQTGSVDEMLEEVASHYDMEIEATLNGLTAMLEPILMVFLGTIVGTIVICMFLPIFRISQIVQF